MSPLTWLGHPSTWLMLFGVWIGFMALFALALGLIARVGAWRGGRR